MKKILLFFAFLNLGFTDGDINEEKPRREFRAEGKIVAVKFSLDGNLIAAADTKNTINIYHTRMGLKLKNLALSSPIVALDASPTQNNVLVSADKSNKITFWDIEKGTVQKKILLKDAIRGVQFRQDGRELLVNLGKKAVFYNVFLGKETQSFKTPDAILMSYNQNTKLLVTTHADNAIIVWDLAKETKKLTLKNHQDKITHIAINKAGTQLVSSSLDKTVKVWDLISGEEITQITHDSPINYVAFDANETKLITASDDKKTIVWDILALTPTILKQYTGESEVTFAGFHPKEQLLLSGYETPILQTWLMR